MFDLFNIVKVIIFYLIYNRFAPFFDALTFVNKCQDCPSGRSRTCCSCDCSRNVRPVRGKPGKVVVGHLTVVRLYATLLRVCRFSDGMFAGQGGVEPPAHPTRMHYLLCCGDCSASLAALLRCIAAFLTDSTAAFTGSSEKQFNKQYMSRPPL